MHVRWGGRGGRAQTAAIAGRGGCALTRWRPGGLPQHPLGRLRPGGGPTSERWCRQCRAQRRARKRAAQLGQRALLLQLLLLQLLQPMLLLLEPAVLRHGFGTRGVNEQLCSTRSRRGPAGCGSLAAGGPRALHLAPFVPVANGRGAGVDHVAKPPKLPRQLRAQRHSLGGAALPVDDVLRPTTRESSLKSIASRI